MSRRIPRGAVPADDGHGESVPVALPAAEWGGRWRVILDTATGLVEAGRELDAAAVLEIAERSLVLLVRGEAVRSGA